jgi:hypothetical protein
MNPAESDLKPLPAGEVQKFATRYQASFAENVDLDQRLDCARCQDSEVLFQQKISRVTMRRLVHGSRHGQVPAILENPSVLPNALC